MTASGLPTSLPPERVTLPGGLQLGFIALPTGSQAAALVRVHAGAHDAPVQYPGLAHFLEHLLFLGSEAYPQDRSLMPFVQGCGGQLNASTRERHTDYFFQVPADAFGEALKRLLDMLARPLLDPAAQLREREVLQAEFLARGRDRETLSDAAIGTALESHPFSAFHAGNRETLPVEEPAFQRALRDYHRRFYHAGQMELLVAAPCSIEVLQAYLDCSECRLPAASPVRRTVPPLAVGCGASLRLLVTNARPCLILAFSLDQMPDATCVALDLLGTWLTSQAPDSLLATLRETGWCETATLRVPYWHENQGVISLELQLTGQGMAARAQIAAAVREWLRFMTEQADWGRLWDDFVRIRERGLLGKEPLARLRYWIDPAAWRPSIESAGVQRAFVALGSRLQSQPPIVLTVTDGADGQQIDCSAVHGGFALALGHEPLPEMEPRTWPWRLPAANRWLTERPAPRVASVMPPSLCWLEPAADSRGQAALYLRWRFAPHAPGECLWHIVRSALRPYLAAATQAGVEVRFEDFGGSWCLALFGYAEALSLVLQDLLPVLRAPSPDAVREGLRLFDEARSPSADELLIRQLMRRLPLLLERTADESGVAEGEADLAGAWRYAHWDALVMGLPATLSGPLQDVLQALPGVPEVAVVGALGDTSARYLWSRFGDPGEETALVLFCPLPTRSIAIEAGWRQLALLMEGAFFRRLRSELQLGYAVFSGFRQFGEHAGIVFAVQSPTASAAEILRHIEEFLCSFDYALGSAGADALAAGGDSAGGSTQDLRRRVEDNWQAQLAGLGPEHPAAVAAAMKTQELRDIAAQLQALRSAAGGWRVIANTDAPDARWLQR